MRGDGGTIACPGCGEQHQSFYRLEGVPMLHCPALEPRRMEWCAVPNARGTGVAAWVILVGAERAPDPAVEDQIGSTSAEPVALGGEPSTRRRRSA